MSIATKEFIKKQTFVDVRTPREKVRDFAGLPEGALILIGVFGIAALVLPYFVEVFFVFGLAMALYVRSVQKRRSLPLAVPKSSGRIDPATGKPGQGIVYIGNDAKTKEEVWMTNDQLRTHLLYIGTTGSGKTEILLSTVFNGLLHGSGFIFVDGKADSSLYAKILHMARAVGREDDLLVINFQTGAKDMWGAQERKMSNSTNPFAVGSSGMLSQLAMGLIDTGKQDVWSERANAFIEAVMKPLVFMRDNHGLLLDVEVIRNYFDLTALEDLAWKAPNKYEGLEETVSGLRAYLKNLPEYDIVKAGKQPATVHEQHGYVTMQLIRAFSSLADTYGYIMKTPLAEIDFVDVFLNRRILVVLLPALEKSPAELQNLGRIVVSAVKATMAVGLGADIEGDTKDLIDNKPTNAPNPFMCILDEYGYYTVKGFSVVPAQARSLGFCTAIAGQDLPALEKTSKEETASTLANLNTKLCGKLECVTTYKYFSDLAGKAYYSKRRGLERDDGDSPIKSYSFGKDVSLEYADRITLDDLKAQQAGMWHLFFENKIIKLKSFYAAPKLGKLMRVNHFIEVRPPSLEEAGLLRKALKQFEVCVMAKDGLSSSIDTNLASELLSLRHGMNISGGKTAFERVTTGLGFWLEETLSEESGVWKRTRLAATQESSELAEAVATPAAEGEDAYSAAEASEQRSERQSLDLDDLDIEETARRLDGGAPPSAAEPISTPARGTEPVSIELGRARQVEDRLGDVDDLLGDTETQAAAIRERSLGDGEAETTGGFSSAAAEDWNSNTEFESPAEAPGIWRSNRMDVSKIRGSTVFNVNHEADASGPRSQGLLAREVFEDQMAGIERRLGAPRMESAETASAVAGKMAGSTAYPLVAPSKVSDDLLEIAARSLLRSLEQYAKED